VAAFPPYPNPFSGFEYWEKVGRKQPRLAHTPSNTVISPLSLLFAGRPKAFRYFLFNLQGFVADLYKMHGKYKN